MDATSRCALSTSTFTRYFMIIGAHESVAGGLFKCFERANADEARAIQIFSKNSNQWKEPIFSDKDVEAFRAARAAFSGPVMAHTSYLINIATDKSDILQRSVDALVSEVLRCSLLGVDFAVLHPGAHLGAGEDAGVARVADVLDEVHERTPKATTQILLENTAGQGSCIGHKFEHLGAIFEQTRYKDRLGVCFDTQHVYAAGYDLSTAEGYASTFEGFDRCVGLGRLRAFHLNDSKKPLGSRVDRHEHIGEGNLGTKTFWRLVNDARFARVPGVLETEPREGAFPFKDEVGLLRSLEGAGEPEEPRKAFALEIVEPSSRRRA
jgi:deoxyribonuclease-4